MKKLKSMMAALLLAASVVVGTAPANALAPTCGFRGLPSCGTAHSGYAYWIMACPTGIIASALAKNWRSHKELTAAEAGTCGLLYWWNAASGR